MRVSDSVRGVQEHAAARGSSRNSPGGRKGRSMLSGWSRDDRRHRCSMQCSELPVDAAGDGIWDGMHPLCNTGDAIRWLDQSVALLLRRSDPGWIRSCLHFRLVLPNDRFCHDLRHAERKSASNCPNGMNLADRLGTGSLTLYRHPAEAVFSLRQSRYPTTRLACDVLLRKGEAMSLAGRLAVAGAVRRILAEHWRTCRYDQLGAAVQGSGLTPTTGRAKCCPQPAIQPS